MRENRSDARKIRIGDILLSMYRVLIPVDTNEDRAKRQAKAVANLPNSDEEVEANILYVFTSEADEDMPEELERFRTATRVASVRRAKEVLEEADIEANVLEDSGNAAKDILDTAEELDIDCIVLGGRKRSPAGKVLFGSITQAVILDSDRPVMVTG